MATVSGWKNSVMQLKRVEGGSTYGGRNVETAVENGKSLFSIIEDKYRDSNKKSLLHRVVVISRLRVPNVEEIGQQFESFFKDIQSSSQTEGVTGLLLLYRKCCVHVLECSQEVTLEVFRRLRKEETLDEGHVAKSKVLIVSHDIPQRLYQHWSYRVLDIEAPLVDEYETTEPHSKLVKDLLTQLLRLGMHLSRQTKVTLKSVIDSLHDKVPDLLPQQTLIGHLLQSDDTTCVITPNGYLQNHEQPYDFVLASGAYLSDFGQLR